MTSPYGRVRDDLRRGSTITPGVLWAHGWRTVAVVFPVLVVSVVVVLSGAAGQLHSWWSVPVGLGLAAGGLAWLAWWRRPARRVAASLLATTAMVWGLAAWWWSPPGTGMLVAALDEVDVPEQARLVEQSRGGNVLCFDVCTTVRRRYVVRDASAAEVATAMRETLRDAGHTLTDPADPRSFTTSLEGTQLYLSGRVDPRLDDAGLELQLRAVASG